MGQSNKTGERNPNNPPSPNKGRSMVPVNHKLKYTEEDMVKAMEFAKRNARGNFMKELGLTELNSGIGSTPSSNWFAKGELEEFPELVNRDRASLCLGHLTDDELASLVFMQGDIDKDTDMRLSIAAMQSGQQYYSKIAAVTGGKERIRWLSRHLELSLQRQRTQRTTIWNYILDTYGECGGEASILEACEKLGLSKEYAMARMHPEQSVVKEAQ
jgi:hypothetical protein